jgi:hypothetical protein
MMVVVRFKLIMKIALEFDDFSPRNTSFGVLEDIKDHYPDFKVTMFTVPWEIRFDPDGKGTPITEERFAPWVEAVKKAQPWLEIALHGMTHAPLEFAELSQEEARKRVVIGEKMFINRQIPLAKVFKAPQWEISKPAIAAANEMGFDVVHDHYYNWNLAEDCPFTKEQIKNGKGIIIAHGHVQRVCNNGLEEVAHRILQIPPGTEFIFLSEALKDHKWDHVDYAKP